MISKLTVLAAQGWAKSYQSLKENGVLSSEEAFNQNHFGFKVLQIHNKCVMQNNFRGFNKVVEVHKITFEDGSIDFVCRFVSRSGAVMRKTSPRITAKSYELDHYWGNSEFNGRGWEELNETMSFDQEIIQRSSPLGLNSPILNYMEEYTKKIATRQEILAEMAANNIQDPFYVMTDILNAMAQLPV